MKQHLEPLLTGANIHHLTKPRTTPRGKVAFVSILHVDPEAPTIGGTGRTSPLLSDSKGGISQAELECHP